MQIVRGGLICGALVAALGTSTSGAQHPVSDTLRAGEWHDYAGDSFGAKYSPLDQINASNVENLQIAWRWAVADRDVQQSSALMRASKYEDTPLMANGVLYTVTPLGMVAALDPASGAPRWVYDPEAYKAGRPHSIGHVTRGLMYWSDGSRERIYQTGSDGYMFSIDAKTGTPDPSFGDGGKVDLVSNLKNAKRAVNFTGRRGVVAGDIVIVGSAILNAIPGREEEFPRGEVRAYDARSGKHLWTFNLVPKPGEFGYDTWLEGSADRNGNTNAWPGMAYDPELDYLYVPTSNPGSDWYGGARPGDNLFGDSLVCLEAKTGKRVWHFQAHHHGIWDYDFPMHPARGEVTGDGKRLKAVMLTNKTNDINAFDRKTGSPLWPMVERPVLQAHTANGERTSPAQPFPTKPPAVDLQGSIPENLIDFTPELKTRALAALKTFDAGPLFTPPSEKGTLAVPGSMGGPNWGGAALDPETGIYYVPTRTTTQLMRTSFPGVSRPPQPQGESSSSPGQGAVDGLSLFKPPYAKVTAVDMNKGEILWATPLGNGPRHHPLLKELNLPPLGDHMWGMAPLVTKTLLFVGVSYRWVNGLPQPPEWAKWNDTGYERKVIYVLNKETGAIIYVMEMDGQSVSAPMTYLHGGKQYLVVASGAGEQSEVVAFTLR
jgi:quinoprotein glucose dehydrogenase